MWTLPPIIREYRKEQDHDDKVRAEYFAVLFQKSGFMGMNGPKWDMHPLYTCSWESAIENIGILAAVNNITGKEYKVLSGDSVLYEMAKSNNRPGFESRLDAIMKDVFPIPFSSRNGLLQYS